MQPKDASFERLRYLVYKKGVAGLAVTLIRPDLVDIDGGLTLVMFFSYAFEESSVSAARRSSFADSGRAQAVSCCQFKKSVSIEKRVIGACAYKYVSLNAIYTLFYNKYTDNRHGHTRPPIPLTGDTYAQLEK